MAYAQGAYLSNTEGRTVVRLRQLCKAAGSGATGCPTVYVDEDTGEFVVQGDLLGTDGAGALENLLPGEGAVRIDVETVLGAVDLYRHEGRR